MISRSLHLFAATLMLLEICLLPGECQVYSWTNQPGDIYNQPCVNQLNFTWTYKPATPVPALIDWSKKDASGTLDSVANFAGGMFTPASNYTGRVLRIGNTAELGLINPTSADNGTYRVTVTDGGGGTITSDDVLVSTITTTILGPAGITARCGEDGKTVTCAGVTTLGIPGAILTLSYGSSSVHNGGTETTVSQEMTSRETVTCSLSGPATECLAAGVNKTTSVECGLEPTTPSTSVPDDTDCLIILIIIIIIIVILVLALIIFHIVIFFVKVSFKVMGILFFVNVILAVAAIIIGIVGIVAFALCEVIVAIIAIVIGVLTHLYKFFLSKHVLKKADVPHRHLCVCFYAYPWKTDDGDAPNGDAPRATANTPATVETIREASSGNSRGNGNQETIPLTKDTTNSQETDERKDGNKETPALGQGNTQTGDRNGGQTETSKSENGEKKKGSKKKKKSKKKRENQDGSQSPPAVSVSGVDVDRPKTAEEPGEQIRSESNLTKVVG